MLMMIKSDVLCGFSDGGQVREFWTYVSSDSDEDSSDYDDSDSSDDDYDTNNGGGGGGRAAAHVQKRGLCRVVNPPPDGYDDSYEYGGGDDDAFVIIFPGPDHEHYSHAHLRHLSQAAIKQYNHKTGGNNRFEFVELVEASVHTAFILVIFKACQSDDPMVTTSFRAKARSASKSLTHSSYDIQMVTPLDSQP